MLTGNTDALDQYGSVASLLSQTLGSADRIGQDRNQLGGEVINASGD